MVALKGAVDATKLKALRRYAMGVRALAGRPKGPALRQLNRQVTSALATLVDMGIELPSDEDCMAPDLDRRLRRQCFQPCEVPSRIVEMVDYQGFRIEVHELPEEKTRNRYMPVILDGEGKVVRRIFVRSKNPYVSIEHFAKRAIDHFRRTGSWPEKQGIAIK